MKKMYIAVHTEVPDYMVPTLVAHSVINAHVQMKHSDDYVDWFANSFKKVVLRVNQKEFSKIEALPFCWKGHENTTMEGKPSCLVVLPMEAEDTPNVLKFAKMWKPIYKEDE